MRKRSLERRANDPQWGERGIIDPVTGLVILLTTLAFAAGLGALINYASSESLPGPAAALPPGAIPLVSFPAPPDSDCARRALALFSGDVTWGAAGWGLPGMSPPRLPFQPTKQEIKEYNDRAIDWNATLRIRVGSVMQEMKASGCLDQQKPIDNPGTDPPKSAEPQIDIQGTYPLTAEGRKGDLNYCDPYAGIATSLTAQSVTYPKDTSSGYTPGQVIVVVNGRLGALKFPSGEMDASLSFSSSSGPNTPNAPPIPGGGGEDHLGIFGQFTASADTVRVSGQLYSSTCVVSFTGLKSGS